MSDPAAKFVLRGGPKDGEIVDAPPGFLHEIADGLAGAIGRTAGQPRIAVEGWVYEFSPDEAGVLIGREATADEIEVQEVFDDAWAEIREEERVAARMRELAPSLLGALKAADRLLEGTECVAGSHGDVVIYAARGETGAAWREAIEQLGPKHGAIPEEVSDEWWEVLP